MDQNVEHELNNVVEEHIISEDEFDISQKVEHSDEFEIENQFDFSPEEMSKDITQDQTLKLIQDHLGLDDPKEIPGRDFDLSNIKLAELTTEECFQIVRRWIGTYINQFTRIGKYYYGMLIVAPTMAKILMRCNIQNNRAINSNLIQDLTNQIKTGNWNPNNGECMRITHDFCMGDAQHRLNAIIESDQSVGLLIQFGCNRKDIETVDIGSSRTAGHVTKFHYNDPNISQAMANKIYSISKLVKCFDDGGSSKSLRNKHYTHPQIFEMYESDKQLIHDAIKYQAAAVKWFPSPTIIAYAYAVLVRKFGDEAKSFFNKLLSGADIAEGSAILTLRNKLISEKQKGRAMMDIRPTGVENLVFLAWKHYKAGNKVTYLKANVKNFPRPY